MSELRVGTLSNAAGTGPATLTGQYAAKAWVNYNAQTNPVTIRASKNVSSITDSGTGNQTVNFTTAMSSANYVAVEGGTRDGGIANAYKNMTDNFATGSVRILTGIQNVNSAADHLIVCVAIFD